MKESTRSLLYFTAGLVTAGIASAVYTVKQRPSTRPRVHESPLVAFKDTSEDALRQLPYPPHDFIPGARDIDTPYGSIRLYEWGPGDASKKVLLLHGISGSCVVLLTLAETLVAGGCRVMLLDLFGRGWSGGPADLPYDGRLYASQIFMSLASSPVSWTGSAGGSGETKSRFTIIGYSLGGGIASNFASYFPDLIEDLVLIAPGGLLKSEWRSSLLYSGVVPETRMKRVLYGRLLGHVSKKTVTGVIAPDLTAQEAAAQPTTEQTFLERAKDLDADAVVAWQLEHNPGFVQAFVSSIRHAPNKYQQKRWRIIGDSVRASKAEPGRGSFSNGNVMLVLGGTDSIIKPIEIIPDAKEVLGEDELEVKIFEDAGHGVAMSHGADIADMLLNRWRSVEPFVEGKPQP